MSLQLVFGPANAPFGRYPTWLAFARPSVRLGWVSGWSLAWLAFDPAGVQ